MPYKRSPNSYCITVPAIALALLVVVSWFTQTGHSQAERMLQKVQNGLTTSVANSPRQINRGSIPAPRRIEGQHKAEARDTYAQLPLASFEANRGKRTAV